MERWWQHFQDFYEQNFNKFMIPSSQNLREPGDFYSWLLFHIEYLSEKRQQGYSSAVAILSYPKYNLRDPSTMSLKWSAV